MLAVWYLLLVQSKTPNTFFVIYNKLTASIFSSIILFKRLSESAIQSTRFLLFLLIRTFFIFSSTNIISWESNLSYKDYPSFLFFSLFSPQFKVYYQHRSKILLLLTIFLRRGSKFLFNGKYSEDFHDSLHFHISIEDCSPTRRSPPFIHLNVFNLYPIFLLLVRTKYFSLILTENKFLSSHTSFHIW